MRFGGHADLVADAEEGLGLQPKRRVCRFWCQTQGQQNALRIDNGLAEAIVIALRRRKGEASMRQIRASLEGEFRRNACLARIAPVSVPLRVQGDFKAGLIAAIGRLAGHHQPDGAALHHLPLGDDGTGRRCSGQQQDGTGRRKALCCRAKGCFRLIVGLM